MKATKVQYGVAAFLLALILATVVASLAGAQTEPPPDLADFQKVVLAQGTEIGEVSELTVAPDGRVFFMNRQGDIQVYKPDTGTTEIMINNPTLGVWSGLEDGGLGITVDPNFAQNNWIYVYYSPLPADANKQRLSRFTVGPDNRVDKASERILLEVPTQRNVCCHSAGSLQFGPDGSLYLATGDNTSSSDNGGYSPHDERPGRSDYDAQKSSGNTNDLRGKIVRIVPRAGATGEIDIVPGDDASYDIPAGNLFGPGGKYPDADPAKTRREIYVMGLRNPYRLGVDQDTGALYWGEVGPDSRSNDPNRGPRHHEEFNRTTEPMNGGWPYCGGYVGEDLTNQDFGGAYVDWDFTNFPGEPRTNPDGSIKRFPCNDPTGMQNTNDSPNSTGLQDLPPMTNPLIPYSDVAPYMYPEVTGATPTGGKVYRQSQNTVLKDTAFPAYYEGSYFISEMSRGWIKEVRLDAQGNILSINPFMEGLYAPIDMEFGPDGSMYVLEYGSSFFSGSPDTKLVRIDYVANGRAPEVKASADKTEGAAPLTVNFSSAGTNDPDGDQITYEWNFGDGSPTSTEANPSHVYEQPGDYQATLTATDPGGKSATAAVTINVGNTRPQVDLELPLDGGIFESGDKVRYKVTVNDAEDPSIDCSKVVVQEGFGHDSHVHPGLSVNGCEGVFQTEASVDHGPEANTYGVISASYTDGGANGEANAPLTGRDISILQPKHRQAEHASGRQGVGFTGYDDKSGTKPGGGALATGMGNGDWISFDPMSLSRIDSVDLTYSGSPAAGAKVELRAGSPTGPVAASVPLNGATQGLYFYKTVSGEITSRAADAGGQPLYFVYSGSGSMNFDEIQFNGPGVAVDVAPRITSATATPNDGPAPLEVNFAAEVDEPDGEAVTYGWDFGVEGVTDDTSTEQNPTYIYEQPGTYTATVTATDASGKSSQRTVQVIARRPCASTPAAEEGYTLLFNGNDLTGWQQSGPGGFTVEDCEMTSFGGLGMLWYSEKQFEDYSLKLQFKLSDDGDNSGVFQRFPDPGNDPFVAVNQGHEVQIKEGAPTDEPQKTGSIYNFDREDARNANPIGEWNDYEIQVVGQTYTMFLNGQKVNEYTSDGSRGIQGFIGLQNHGTNDKVSFRTVQIKELEVEEPFVNTLSGDKTRGAAPLTVNYTADAFDRQGDAITYEWDFGVEGTETDTSNEQNPTFTYNEAGTYTATVTTTDAGGATATDTVEVVVEEPAVQTHVIDAVDTGGASRWVPSDLTVKVGDTVRWEFDQALVDHTLTTLGTSSGDAGWNFREYRSPGGAAFEYTFTEPGTYDFYCELHSGMNGKITVVEDGGSTNQPPTADASASPTNGSAPLEVAFTGGGTDPDGDALTYSWDFGVEGTETDKATTKDASFTYEQPGTYTATLTVGDGQGGEATDSVQVVVDQPAENQAPTVEASADPPSGDAPLSVAFLADAADPDGRLVIRGPFEVFASGPELGYTDAVSGTGELTRLPEGTEAMLDVSGLKPNKEYDVHVHAEPCSVNNGGPHYMFDPTQPATSDNEIWLPFTSDAQGNGHAMAERPLRAGPEAVSIVIHDKAEQGKRIACADLSRAEDDLTYSWDFGVEGATDDTSTERSPNYTYNEAGTYTATATVTDPDGAEASDTVEVTVQEGGPADTEPPDTTITEGPRGSENSSRATFEFSSTEEGSTFECSLDGSEYEPCSSPKEYTDLEDGRHAFRVRATDEAGNTDESPARRKWKVDTRGPKVRDLTPRDGARTADRTPAIGATIEDAQSNLSKDDVRLLVDGKRVGEFSYDRDTGRLRYVPGRQLSYGNHTVEVVTEDAAGNRATEEWRFRVVRR